tara:strand:+ start:235 stop:408 length:174 start_codon:yes stop_codon:yes gene_type:complete
MIKVLLFSLFVYFGLKILGPLIKLFKFQQTIKKKDYKANFHKKLSKMDIQDAEFEEN